MGLCVEADENKQKLDFEIRRESVIFIIKDKDISITHSHFYKSNFVEIDKKVLAKIAELCQDKEWKDKIFGEY